jgi:hypothetical protein
LHGGAEASHGALGGWVLDSSHLLADAGEDEFGDPFGLEFASFSVVALPMQDPLGGARQIGVRAALVGGGSFKVTAEDVPELVAKDVVAVQALEVLAIEDHVLG